MRPSPWAKHGSCTKSSTWRVSWCHNLKNIRPFRPINSPLVTDALSPDGPVSHTHSGTNSRVPDADKPEFFTGSAAQWSHLPEVRASDTQLPHLSAPPQKVAVRFDWKQELCNHTHSRWNPAPPLISWVPQGRRVNWASVSSPVNGMLGETEGVNA